MRVRRHHAAIVSITLTALLLIAAGFVVGFTLVSRGRGVPGSIRVGSAPASTSADASAAATADEAAAVVAHAVGTSGGSKKMPKAPRAAKLPVGPSLDAYKGLGTWVDIYDARAWSDPAGTVRDMAAHGVRTLFVETANSRSAAAFENPGGLQAFIREAHARKMRVVAWYLPDMQNSSIDYDRIAQAIRFTTPDGQKFDSFALDIESTAISSESARNVAIEALTRRIRGLVGKEYPLGAIIPSPSGLTQKAGYWDTFPYSVLAQTYDVFLPMGYYTYHGSGGAAARDDTLANIRILRANKGCEKTPIHVIGGIADNSTPSEVRAFVQAAEASRVFGASLYGWAGTTSPQWQELRAIR